MRIFNWEKKGLLFSPDLQDFSHGSHPCIQHIKNNDFIVAFTCRNSQQRSHIFLSKAVVCDGTIQLIGTPKLALSPGPLGHFDSDGVLSSSFLELNGKYYLYYGGWENLVSVPYTANTGRLIFDLEAMNLSREFASPVLARNPQSPIFSGAPCFVKVNNEIWAWYTSAIKWIKLDDGFRHYYSIRRATSIDGITWCSDSDLAIPFADEYEYAVARSTICKIDDVYYMWFAHRESKELSTYRIGVAYSKDLLNWVRNDDLSGIDVSKSGWDSNMLCYPQVFNHDGWLYMLYNGNNYGETGFGYAVLKLE